MSAKRSMMYRQKTKIRHTLKKHQKLQKITTELYLKYCSLAGFLHTTPDYFIIGFPKCGTTSLHEYLGEHPDVYLPFGKEIDFFDRLYSRGLNWYKTSFPNIVQKSFVKNFQKKEFLTGEATPRYIVHPHAVKRIHNTIPNGKFIILMRNPIDRAYSHYKMNLRNDYEYRSFEDALKFEKERIDGRYEKMIKNENYYSWDYDLYAYLEHGKYYEKIKKWYSVFPKEQFLIIQSENFQKNTSDVYKQVLKFLNLQEFELDEYKFFKKRNYKENEKIDSQLRKQLVEYFKPSNEKLYKLIGEKFDWDR